MALEPIPNSDPNPAPAPAADLSAAPVVAARPDKIPETFWDAEKNAPKFDDIGNALSERESLKTAADARAAQIPAKPEDYKFELPAEFALPEGYRWSADPKEPLVASFRDYAVANKLTQPEVAGLVGVYAANQAREIQAQQAFDAEQTKQLGEKATERREAAQTWIAATLTPAQQQVAKTLLSFKDGVELFETIIQKVGGVTTRGTPGSENQPAPDPTARRLNSMYPTMAN